MKTFKIYRASAGSGKTYQLALSYIALALRVSGNFKHILAVTFTNKATREMKERIIHFLGQLATGKDNELSKQLEDMLNIDAKLVKLRANQTLRDILHHYGHFNVTTIDSFFQSIIRSFSREIGLLGNYEVEMDTNKVLDVLIDQTLADVGPDKELTKWLIAFAESRVEAGDKWDMRTDIAKLAKEIFSEKFKSFEKVMNDNTGMREAIRTLSNNLNTYRKQYETHLEELAQEGSDFMKKAGLEPAQFKYGSGGGPSAFFRKVQNDKPSVPGVQVLNGLSGYEGWIKKNDPQEPQLTQALDSGLMDALTKLCDYIDHEGARYRGVVQFQRQIFSFGILTDFIKRVESYRKENDVMLISDINYFLNEIIEDNETPFIYEKTGSYFKYFLIDEFQDTSGFQWENFKPLIRDSLAQGHESMVVGDGKQSIYRFREGDWNLLNNRINNEIDAGYQTTIELNTNYRSACNVIDFNNSTFKVLPEILKKQFDFKRDGIESKLLDHLSQSYHSLYEDVRQSCKKQNDEKGYVKIHFTEGESKVEEWKNDMLEDLEGQVESLLETGIAPGDIAILVRKKKEGAMVVNKLLSHSKDRSNFQYKVISNESLFLDASWAVRLIIYGIRLINNPADPLARVGLLYEYLNNRPNNTLKDHEIFEIAIDSAKYETSIPEIFKVQLSRLKLQSLLDQAESLIRIFELDRNEEHTAFLSALQNALSDFMEDVSNITGDFREWWENTGMQTSVQIPEEADAIQVLTIHKAKGLEYKAVILPFCNWNVDHEKQNSPVLWCASQDPLFKGLQKFPLKYSSSLKDTIFNNEYFEEYGKVLIDNINLLYVALTRAEEVLIVNARLPKENKSRKEPEIKDVSGLLYELFNSGTYGPENMAPDSLLAHYNPETHCYEHGKLTRQGHLHREQESDPVSGPYSSTSWGAKVRIRKRADGRLNDLFEKREARISLGILIHQVLSKIETSADTEQQIFLLQQEGLLSENDLTEVRDQIRQILTNKQVEPWFDGSYRIKTECPILTNTGHKYQPDRVMLKGKEAIVVDFKTGGEDNSHTDQIKKYRKLLQEMDYEVTGTYLLYTKQNRVEEVI